MMVLQALYNSSDDQIEFKVRDRASFQRFLGLSPEDTVPDAKTLWLFRELLARHGLIDKLFQCFDEQLWSSGLMPKGGQIIDASLVNVPKNRNTRDENRQIKEGKIPGGWDDKPNIKRQKDEDVRWTETHGKSYNGHKNHINIDNEHKPIWPIAPRRAKSNCGTEATRAESIVRVAVGASSISRNRRPTIGVQRPAHALSMSLAISAPARATFGYAPRARSGRQ
jgi:hypothetical protein